MLPSHPVEVSLVLVLVPLALCAPTASLGVILLVTAIVPFDTQNQFSIGGGVGSPGLLPVDVLLLLGLSRAGVLLITRRLRPDAALVIAGAVLAGLALALGHGLAAGAAASDAGTEARCLAFGAGTFVLAWPLLQNQATRARLYGILLAIGIALGLWGLAQVVLHIGYTSGGDIGVRPGIDQIAAAGGGQLQGGIYAFPVAVSLSFAALLSPPSRSSLLRALIAAAFALNCVCVLLTYERSIWAAAAIGCLVAALRSGRRAWPAAAGWLALSVAGLLAYVAVSPAARATAVQRVESVFSLSGQSSSQARQVESDAVLRAIRSDPIAGQGFGAMITWGKRNQFATRTTNFSHNGYLWLAWKVGVPFALLLVTGLWFAALRRRRRTSDSGLRAFRAGSHAALFASLLVCVTFPEFNALGITAVLGLLTATCLMRDDYRDRIDTAGASTIV
jgi:O-Antigen ligase